MAVTSSAGRNPTSWQLLNRLGGNSCQVSSLASSGTGSLQTVNREAEQMDSQMWYASKVILLKRFLKGNMT